MSQEQRVRQPVILLLQKEQILQLINGFLGDTWLFFFFFFLNVFMKALHCKDAEKYIQGSQRWQGKVCPRQGLLESSTSQACREMQQGAVLLQWVTAQERLWAGRCPQSHPRALSIPSGLQWAHEFGGSLHTVLCNRVTASANAQPEP